MTTLQIQRMLRDLGKIKHDLKRDWESSREMKAGKMIAQASELLEEELKIRGVKDDE